MTQKSDARKARDAHEKLMKQEPIENQCWDDLKNIYTKCQIGLNNTVQRVTALYSIEGLGAAVPNRQEVAVQLRGLARDRDEFQKELSAIYSLHADRSGGSEDSYLNRESLDIFESYRNWQSKFEAVFVPTVEQLIAVVAEIGARYVQSQQTTETEAVSQ